MQSVAHDTDSLVLEVSELTNELIACVEVSNIARCSSETNELRDIDYIGCSAREITIFKWKLAISK